MSANPEIQYLPFSKDKIPALAELFYSVFGKRHSIEYLTAKYDTKYLGIENVAHFAFVDGQAVAFAGALPMPFLMAEKTLVGVQLCDYMTLPEFRRLGIHTQLVERNLAASNANGADFAFAMHTQNSFQGDQKIDWQNFDALKVFVLPIKENLASKVLGKFKHIQKSRIEKFDQSLLAFRIDLWGGFETNGLKDNTLYVDYSRSFLKYKAFGGSYLVSLPGFNAWLKPNISLEVGAIEITDANDFEKGFDILVKAAENAQFRKIIIQLPESSGAYPFLSRKGESVSGYRPAIIPLNMDCVVEQIYLNGADFDTF